MLRKAVFSAMSAFVVASIAIAEDPKKHWSHNTDPRDPTGQKNWASICEEFKACEDAPLRSPINIDTQSCRKNNPPFYPVANDYLPAPLYIKDTGHGYEINCDNHGYIDIRFPHQDHKKFKRFWLKQFHPHAQSEHTFDNKHADMVFHFVHTANDGQICVVAVMIDEAKQDIVFSN